MNRIDQLFQNKQKDILSIYYTAGFPEINETLNIAQHLEEGGADIIEIGMPYSDPIADGPTIQDSNKIALDNGMNVSLLFEQLQELRAGISLPVILMGYINPVIQYGIEKFCKQCQAVGVDGLILPDLPMGEYLSEYKEMFEEYGLKNIFLITPQTSEQRIREIDDNTSGFIYMVSSASTTGAQDQFGDIQETYFKRVRSMGLKNPTLTGFGVSNHETFSKASAHGAGAIIGSAFIKLLSDSTNRKSDIKQFVKDVKG